MKDSDNKFLISEEILEKQAEYSELIRELIVSRFSERSPKAFVHTYGCQGNVADGEKLKGMLEKMGYEFTEEVEEADLVLYNTCAIREHAEDRVFGNLGALKPLKKRNPDMIIALCGCMMQQNHVSERIYKSFPYVNLLFGTHVIYKLPELMYRVLSSKKRVFDTENSDGNIAEGLPTHRDGSFRAWLPIMYGCNNFCSYCIVPYVRGRERSRDFDAVVKEAEELVAQGYKEITLLGQNVNSYNRDKGSEYNFPALLRRINAIEGDFIIRFMTSHPKDCTRELLETMASCEKVAKHLHLPVQSGNDRVLKEMNRVYNREKYVSLIKYAYELMPDLCITSDIIVGFPGETYEEFLDTVSLIKEVGYSSLYTFIFSARKGTKAYNMPDPVSKEDKGIWFRELLAVQEEIAAKRTASMQDKIYRVLCEEKAKRDGYISGRTSGNIIIEFPADESVIGSFRNVRATVCKTWVVDGELVD